MKIKAILTIVISLLIGFVLGFLVSGQLQNREMEKKHKHSYQEMFIYRTLGVIEPTEAQKDSIFPIIQSYATKTMDLKNRVSGEFNEIMEEMSDELRPYVTDEQLTRLKENNARLNRRYGHEKSK